MKKSDDYRQTSFLVFHGGFGLWYRKRSLILAHFVKTICRIKGKFSISLFLQQHTQIYHNIYIISHPSLRNILFGYLTIKQFLSYIRLPVSTVMACGLDKCCF